MSAAPMYGRRTSPGDPDPVVSFDNVRLGFDEGDVLRGVSFRVLPRETLVLLGETGTGKTLTLKLAAGLLHPSRGTVRVLDLSLIHIFPLVGRVCLRCRTHNSQRV